MWIERYKDWKWFDKQTEETCIEIEQSEPTDCWSPGWSSWEQYTRRHFEQTEMDTIEIENATTESR